MAASHGLAIDHLDVVTAFLNPEADDPEPHMEIPEGWDDGNHDSEITARRVIRKKALYGLKQAPRLWYGDINDFLLLVGFTQSKADPNLYIFGDSDITSIGGRPLILPLLTSETRKSDMTGSRMPSVRTLTPHFKAPPQREILIYHPNTTTMS